MLTPTYWIVTIVKSPLSKKDPPRSKISKNFTLDEFLPPDIYGMSPNGILFPDSRIIQIAQFIRDRFGKPVTINNYLDGVFYYIGDQTTYL